MSKCLLVGIEENNWTDKKSGEFVQSSILHVVLDKPARLDPKLRGQRVESIKVRFDVSDLQVGKRYELIYESVRYGTRSYAQLADFVLCD